MTEITNEFSNISKEIIAISQVFQQFESYNHVYTMIRNVQDLEKENLQLVCQLYIFFCYNIIILFIFLQVSQNMLLRLKLKDLEETDEDYKTHEIQREIDINIKKHQSVLNSINETLEEIRHEQISIYENSVS